LDFAIFLPGRDADMTEPLAVLYEDAHVLAAVKPAGLLTQGTAAGEPTLEQAVRRHLAAGDAPVYLGTVHRLDRPVSGVVVWAKTPKAARRLSAQFAARGVVKEYWAVVESAADRPGSGSGVWDDWLSASADASGVVRPAPDGSPGARRAVTRYEAGRPARLPEGTAWLRLWPETGRTHQLRAQAALHGLPVWGDLPYGAARAFPLGIALHARSLTVRHPTLGRPLTVTAALPAIWAEQGIDLGGTEPGPGPGVSRC
jgi:23S rRNA pseudouridine1911/1915/1917 synthase